MEPAKTLVVVIQVSSLSKESDHLMSTIANIHKYSIALFSYITAS